MLLGPLLGGAAGALRAVRRGAARRRGVGRRAAAGGRPTTPARGTASSTRVDAALATARRDGRAAADRRPPLGRPRHAAARELRLRSRRAGPLLVVGTYRDTELGRAHPLTGALADLQRDGALDRVGLRGLDARTTSRELARSLLGADELAAARPRAHRRQRVLRRGGAARAGRGGTPTCPRACATPSASGSSRLGDDANALLAAAAVLGLEPTRGALQAHRGLEPDAAEAALDEVLRARLLRPAPAPRRFEFAHALVREAVYDELQLAPPRAPAPPRGRRADARSARTATSRRSPSTCSRRRRPRTRGRPPSMLVRAGRRALERLAYEDAAERFDARARGARAGRRRGRGRPGCCSPAATRCCAPASPTRRARRSPRPRGSRAAPATRRCWREAALGYAGLGDRDRRPRRRGDRAARGGARARADDPRCARALQARLAVELYYAPGPRPLRGAQRRGRRDRARRRRPERARLARSTRATSRCGGPDRLDERLGPPPR